MTNRKEQPIHFQILNITSNNVLHLQTTKHAFLCCMIFNALNVSRLLHRRVFAADNHPRLVPEDRSGTVAYSTCRDPSVPETISAFARSGKAQPFRNSSSGDDDGIGASASSVLESVKNLNGLKEKSTLVTSPWRSRCRTSLIASGRRWLTNANASILQD